MWDQAVVTNAGKALLQQWAGGGTLTIDGAKAGAGAVSQLNLINQTAVTQEKQTLSIISAKQVEGGTQFHVQITAPDAGYTAKQIGIYGRLDSGDSTLIALYQDESGITVPSKAEMPDFVYAFYATIQVGNTGTLSVTLDASALVTQATLTAAVAKAGDMKRAYTTRTGTAWWTTPKSWTARRRRSLRRRSIRMRSTQSPVCRTRWTARSTPPIP